MSDMRVEFWRDERDWPRDSSKFIFLARAVQMIGNRLFPGQWTGLEPQIKLLPKLMPEEVDSDLMPIYSMDPHDGDLPKDYFSRYGGPYLSGPARERANALLLVATDHTEKRPGLRRFAEVKQRIISWAEEGKLVMAVRALIGGEFSELPSSFWNADNLDLRFPLCQIDFDPFGSAAAGEPRWIFVSRASLERSIESLKKPGGVKPGQAEKSIESLKKPGGSKTGRPEKFDWEEGKLYFHKLLEQNGDFKDPLNRVDGWRSQNDAVSLIIEHLAKISNDDGPSPSAVKAKVRDWLEEFRSGQ
jgi:hypothetical protein